MTTAIAFMKWTDAGTHTYKETVHRLAEGMQLGKQFGVEVKETYWTPGGPYDLISIAEGPNYESLVALSMALQSLGNVRVEGIQAFRPDEMREVIALGE
jgi:uncharacterized protein with GYD domain